MLGAFVLLLLCFGGCSPRAGVPAALPRGGAGAVEELPRLVVTPEGARSVPELYEQALQALEHGDALAAAQELDRVYELEPDGPLAPRALLHGAEARERAGDRAAALSRLEVLVRRFPEGQQHREALTRIVRLQAFEGRFEEAGTAGHRLLSEYGDPSPIERIVAHGGVALGLVASGDLERSGYHVAKARDVIEQHQLDAAGRVPRDLAAVYYALGEIRRLSAERIALSPTAPDFAARLERRCQLVLDAQSAYSDAMRAYDARWSAMAGFRVGELYQRLHAELVGMGAPSAAGSPAERALFEGAMRLRYSVLLDKARAMMDHTLAMAERTGEQSAFVARAAEAAREIDVAAERERRVIEALPYSREQLQSALRALERRAAERRSAGGGRSGDPRSP